ncbi:ABC transporter permease [Dictyobacter vulcani]|uniref:ABC transporter permease n=1 Tax=Dictyobacter vulcani TaxID=2607529 RepID=A0A5J4KWS1_9CHLR|nr:ABC transporter permease [Dictyobacter vulcani]GER90977.1 ABC transporter permease [Dictyobacter vulcani]
MTLLHDMLTSLTSPQVVNGLIQVAAASVMVLIVVIIASFNRVKIARETITSMARGFIQILLVGIILVLIINASIIFGYLVLAMMIIFAAILSYKRGKGLPGAFKISLLAIGIGSGITILIMALVGVIEPKIANLIPVGSMIISSSMRTNSLSLNRFRAEIESHVGQIEAGLALGAPPATVIETYLNNTVYASIIPAVDTLRSLGIVFIPGLASGMLLAGANPIYAAEYQFAAMAMLFAASTLTGLVSGLLLRSTIFSAAEQLTLRPQITKIG